MRKPAKQFINLLEKQQLLSPDILNELRRQIAESKTRLTTELIAKLLVDNGHLTKFQATKLIAEIKEADDGADMPDEEEEELGFAEDAVDNKSIVSNKDSSKGDSSKRESTAKVAAVFVDDDEPEDAIPADTIEAVDEEPSKAVEVVPVAAPPRLSNFGDLPRPVTRLVRPQTAKANPYDSFRILGVGLILALILIAGFFLVNHLLRGNADERLRRADDAYEQRSYETAAVMYREFADVFPANAKASYAKVRAVLAAIRKDSEGAPDPRLGLAAALNVLPGVVGEAGWTGQRSDLAGALIALAGKFNERADRTQATAERKALMEDMDKLLAVINDPQFVGENERNQQEPTLNRVREDRNRILREINRDEELALALSEIDKRLEARDALGAYDVRKALIRRYPSLETDPSLNGRVVEATVIQRSLVKPGSLNIELSNQSPAQVVGRSFVLANRTGAGAPSLAGQVLFAKVKGSVYGIEGDTGNILWRQFIGREFKNDPIRVGQTSASDAIVCQPERGHISRVVGKTGATTWFANLGAPAHTPVVEGNDLFVAAFDGTIASLDAGGGQTKWVTELPQPIPVSPGVASGKPHLYVPAEHSNLYVVSRTDGACQEVHYLGHRSGAIVVPPILLLGQLFVFENINSETAKIRIFSTSDQGLELREAQVPITMDGNIVVSPQADGRRLIVQSDLGQIKILDIEPTVQSQKVTEIANVPKNIFAPKLSWLAASNNRIWVADTRFTRFDLQVTSGRMGRAWIKNDGDQFVGPPQKFEDVIVHTRVLRGNQNIRLSAVDADSGNPLWETDLGTPVILVQSSNSGFDVVNSSAMYFDLGDQSLRNEADANPGQGKPAMMFANPVELSDGKSILFNRSRSNQLALYSPTRPKLRLLSANFGMSSPSSDVVAVGDKIAVGLDGGQFVLLDPTNGSLAASPYQPPMEPGKKVRWNTPAYLEDSQTLIVASDLQKLVRLSVGSELRSLREIDLESPLRGPILAMGNQICAVESTRSGDSLMFFDQTNLSKGVSLPLPGRLISGPFSTQQGCVLQTDSQLMAVSSDGKQLWSVPFSPSPLVSQPALASNHWVMVTRAGEVWVIDPDDGAVVGKADAGQAFSSAPLILPTGLLVGSEEGAVLSLPIPTRESEER